jgi:hypothetical protein
VFLFLISQLAAEDSVSESSSSSASSSSCRRASEDDDHANSPFHDKKKLSCNAADAIKLQKFTELLVENPMKFLKEHVFGQKDASVSSSKEFLSMLDEDDAETSTTTNLPTDNEPQNPIFSFFNDLSKMKIPSILDLPSKEPSYSQTTEMKENELVTKLINNAKVLKQEEETIDGLESINRMTEALKEAAVQLKNNFADILDSMDAYLPFSIVYFFEKEDSRMHPLWKRRMHRFYKTVKKKELIELHDALYLSTLAYADTLDHFKTGLRAFQDNSWEVLYGTTKSLPDMPSNFLLIHKELATLEQPSLKTIFDFKKKPEVVVTLVVRGTKDLSDALSDSLLDPKEYKGGYVHGGILQSGKNLAEYFLPKLHDLHLATGKYAV